MDVAKIISTIGKSESRKAEGLRFAITGAIATLIQYGFYLLFLSVYAMSAVIATVISYGLSFVANYFMSNLFTFRTRPGRKNAVSFVVSHLVNLGLQTILVAVFSRCFNPEYALLPAMTICVPCNFFLVRFALKSKHFTSDVV